MTKPVCCFSLAAATSRVAILAFVGACGTSSADGVDVATNASQGASDAPGAAGAAGATPPGDVDPSLGSAGAGSGDSESTSGPVSVPSVGSEGMTDGLGRADPVPPGEASAGAGGASTGQGGQAGAGNVGAGGSGDPASASCTGSTLPAITDYGARGPFATTTVNNTGPDGAFTIFRPNVLGQDGFKHAPLTWGNGANSTPSGYAELLGTIASHGFIVIASNNMRVNAQLLTTGLDWLIAQNDTAGDFEDRLATSCAVSIGYSLGGGAAVTAGSHPSVATTVSFHGLQGPAERLHGPLLLFTSTGDTFVSAAQFVTPTFNRSTVQTFFATLIGGSHLTPTGNAGAERAPTIAWLRLWVYGDQAARRFFDGEDCSLCVNPWTNPRQKNWQ